MCLSALSYFAKYYQMLAKFRDVVIDCRDSGGDDRMGGSLWDREPTVHGWSVPARSGIVV